MYTFINTHLLFSISFIVFDLSRVGFTFTPLKAQYTQLVIIITILPKRVNAFDTALLHSRFTGNVTCQLSTLYNNVHHFVSKPDFS